MKQVIVVNKSLKLPKGKLAAQVAHAAVAAFLYANNTTQQDWLNQGMPKVVLVAEDQDALIAIQALAIKANIPEQLIRDAGKTVVEAGTITCLGLGPAKDEELSAITGELKLL